MSDKKAGSTTEPCPLSEEKKEADELLKVEDETKVTVRAILFFDGTLNNQTNVEAGKKMIAELEKKKNAPQTSVLNAYRGTKAYEKRIDQKIEKILDSSYGNDLSNIARMRPYTNLSSPEYDYTVLSYIEGVGTENNESDHLSRGAALGYGSTGVSKKTEKGANSIIEKIRSLDGKIKKKKIRHLHIDVFGFSRGAATARHFIHVALNNQKFQIKTLLENEGYSVDEVKFRFVGLYDTVASLGFSHDDNTEELQLYAVQNAEKVVHLCASEEHRNKFRLTNISSAKNGIELFLPGVHSDIGGGYRHNEEEKDKIVLELRSPQDFLRATTAIKRLEEERSRLIDSGWYTDKDLVIDKPNFQLLASRRKNENWQGISQKYSFIPLQKMAGYAKDSKINIKRKLYGKYAIPPELNKIKAEIDANACNDPTLWQKNTTVLKKLRYNFLHFSAHYGGFFKAHRPQFDEKGRLKGKRTRIIQDGSKKDTAQWLSDGSFC
jgi:hypothetical protein